MSIKLEIASSTFPKVVGVMSLDTSTKTWMEAEVDENKKPVKKIFVKNSGTWTYAKQGNFVVLKNDNKQVGTLNDLNPDSPGSSGSGFSVKGGDNESVDFKWKKIGDIVAEAASTVSRTSLAGHLAELSAFLDTSKNFPKLFPNGINKIRLVVKPKDAEFEVEISGPDRAALEQRALLALLEQSGEMKEVLKPRLLKTLSGAAWVSEFPDSQSTSDLTATFKPSVDGFIGAMQDAAASVVIGTTLRPPKRAYLMHYAWRIAKKEIKAADAPAMAGVDIEWVHPSDAASIQAAADMVQGYHIVAKPALNSRHTEGRAIDMTISWQGTLDIKKKDGSSVKITSTPRNGENADLQSVGKGYGVIKATFAGDPPHWSDDGH